MGRAASSLQNQKAVEKCRVGVQFPNGANAGPRKQVS